MPPAKRSTSTRSRTRASAFKPPAALANLNNSIAAAEKALTQLSKHAGRDVSKGTQDLYKNLKKFVTTAQRDSGKFAKAMQKDFDQAQTTLTRSRAARNASTTRSRSTTAKGTATRSSAKKTTATRRPRAAAKRATKRS